MQGFAIWKYVLCLAVSFWALPGAAWSFNSSSQCVVWHDDYSLAAKLARNQRKMLFIFFHAKGHDALRNDFERRVQCDASLRGKLQHHIALKLPVDAQATINGKRTRLLEHKAFSDLLGQQGIVMIDFAHSRTSYYGYVVSALPFMRSKYYSYRPEHIGVVLDLPPGSLTQRTLILAVRTHPEAPASTRGQLCSALAGEARSHAAYQASIGVQGHHSWENRFHRISAQLPGGLRAQEVVAESWPNEHLLDAAVDCVQSWRQSSGHWDAVRSHQPRFGYDMKRGRNGIWYATGLFGNRR